MEKWKRDKSTEYPDGGPIVIDVLPQPFVQPPANSQILIFQLSADILLIAGTIEASDVLYHNGHTHKAIERFDGAMPIVEKVISRTQTNKCDAVHLIAGIAQKLAHALKTTRPTVVDGSFFHEVKGRRAKNLIDPLVEKLIDVISNLNLS